MSEHQSWWEKAGTAKVLLETAKRPKTVLRQILVASDMAQAAVGSDQETFPTLSPGEAEKFLIQSNHGRK